MMDGSRKRTVLMLPWLAHGHLWPFLGLAKSLSRRNFTIHLCSSPANLKSINGKIGIGFKDTIHLVEIHLPSLPDLPPNLHTTNGLPPHLMPVLHQAFAMAEPNFSAILQELKPDLLIHDYFLPWAPAASRAHDIPAIVYFTTSAAFAAYGFHLLKRPGLEFPFPSIRYPDGHPFPQFFVQASSYMLGCLDQSSGLTLIKTFSEIEGKYMDYFSSMCNKKVLSVPVVQGPESDGEKSEIIEWLDKKEKNSTVFVSFGSEFFLSKEEIEEVALGLELSGVNFIWVVRFPIGESVDLRQVLPEGYLQQVKDKGLVVQGWAPQIQILAHPNTSGFLSHCGWNSMMESIKLGVPIVAAPMNIDQPVNAKVLEEVGISMEIERDEKGRLMREMIGEGIRHVVMKESGESLRSKMRELSDAVKCRMEEEIDVLSDELVRFCRF